MPRSKVSVPLVVVMTTLSNTPPKAINPPEVLLFPDVSVMFPAETQVFPVMFVRTTVPLLTSLAPLAFCNKNPVVLVAVCGEPALKMFAAAEAYPEVVTEPDPICSSKFALPLRDTFANITVIRFTHDGKELNVMLVPLVDATAVPEVMPRIAPELIVTLFEPSKVIDIINSKFPR